MKKPERRHWRSSGVSIVNFEHISYIFLVFPLLTLNKEMFSEQFFLDKLLFKE